MAEKINRFIYYIIACYTKLLFTFSLSVSCKQNVMKDSSENNDNLQLLDVYWVDILVGKLKAF